MRVKAFKIRQWSGSGNVVDLYVTTMRCDELLKRYAIDRWTPENPQGYQRMPDESRLTGRIGSPVRYILRELGCFPTSILVSVRGEISFKPLEDLGWCQLGELEIPDDETLWLIDGQHRVEALKRAVMKDERFRSYPLIVSIMVPKSVFEEMLYFYVVNKRQRSVPTDLAYRHLQRMLAERGVKWLYEFEGVRGLRAGIAAEVVDYLNERPDSPWYGRIRRVGEEASPRHVIKDGTMVKSISVILKEKTFEGMGVKELGTLLIAYWNALRDLYPEAFREPKRYMLLKTPGVFSMHMLFPTVYARCAVRGIVTSASMRNVLRLLQVETPDHPQAEFREPITSKFWSREHGPAIALSTNLKMIRELYMNMALKIRLAEATSSRASRLSP